MLSINRLGDIINRFRQETLDLEKVPAMFDANLVQAGKVPFTYCWSPALIPKPADWPATIGKYLQILKRAKADTVFRCMWILLSKPAIICSEARHCRVSSSGLQADLHRVRKYRNGGSKSYDRNNCCCGRRMRNTSYCIQRLEQTWNWLRTR